MANTFNLNANPGTTIPILINCAHADGTVVNLTGCQQIWVTFKTQLTDSDPGLLQKTLTTGGVVISDNLTGKVYCEVGPTDLPYSGGYQETIYMDVKIKEGNGREWVVASGSLTLIQSVTRAI